MTCHKYAKEIELVEEAICQTYDLLYRYEKYEDCERLLDPALQMLIELRKAREVDNQSSSILDTKPSRNSAVVSTPQVNLPLEFTISTVLILRSMLYMK